MSLLEVRDLHASVAGKQILKGVNLSVNAGEVHAIMGPNGSGKSTFAQVLAGRDDYEITSGEVLYDGKPLLGAYRVDDDGVPAMPVTLVEDGQLKAFYMSRVPTQEIAISNGHGRRAGGGAHTARPRLWVRRSYGRRSTSGRCSFHPH